MLNKECHRSWWQGNAPVVFSLNTCWDIHVCLRASSRGCRDTVRWLLVHQTYNKDSGQETHLAAVAAVAALLWLWSRLRRKQYDAIRRLVFTTLFHSIVKHLLQQWQQSHLTFDTTLRTRKVSKEVSKADMRYAQDYTVSLIQPRVKLFKQLKKSVQLCASGPLATLIAMLSLQTTQHCSQAAAR